jgi:hypothetical protein
MVMAFDEPITFGWRGSARSLRTQGIEFEDAADRSWTTSQTAELEVELPLARQDVTLELEAMPFLIPDSVRYQQISLFVSGMFVSLFSLEGFSRMKFRVGRHAISIRPTRISLAIPTAVSPTRLGIGDDKRDLGVHLATISFRL